MGEVGDALTEYARVVDAAGFAYFDRMAPGRSRQDVAALMERSGLAPHDDALDWFSFHDGLQPQVGARSVDLFDDVTPCSLDEALAHRDVRLSGYLAHLGLGDEEIDEIRRAGVEMPYDESWLPISIGQQTCVVDSAAADAPSPLLALWDDEHTPRVKAESLAAWVRGLAGIAAGGGLSWRTRTNAAGVDSALFEHGSLTMIERFVPQRESLVQRLETYRSPGILLRHSPVGSIAGNDGLERQQAEVVATHLRDALHIGLPVDYLVGPVEGGRVTTVHIMAVYPDD